MGFWSFMGLAAFLMFSLEAYRIYVKSKTSATRDIAKIEARVEALEADGGLEERVRTLEAIVTDPKTRLNEAIDNLHQA